MQMKEYSNPKGNTNLPDSPGLYGLSSACFWANNRDQDQWPTLRFPYLHASATEGAGHTAVCAAWGVLESWAQSGGQPTQGSGDSQATQRRLGGVFDAIGVSQPVGAHFEQTSTSPKAAMLCVVLAEVPWLST